MNVQPWTEEHTRDALGWHYEAPYDFYDFSADPSDVKQLHEQPELYRAILAPDSSLSGFWFFVHRDHEVIVGLGLRPELTGRGLGAQFFDDALDYARAEWSPKRFRLWVAAWNERAIRVYERRGFREVGREQWHFELLGDHEFVEMERDA